MNLSILLLPNLTLAANDEDAFGLEKTRGAANLPKADLQSFIGQIIQGLLGIVGLLFFVLAVYGGFIWMKARGNEKEVERAKEIITNAIIGIIIVAAAYAITAFILKALAPS